MRCWVRGHPVNESRLQDGSTAKAILSKLPELDACFDPHSDANPPSRAQGLLRWQMNPDRDWGPKPRAAKSGKEEFVEDRRLRGAKKADESRAKRKADVMRLMILVFFTFPVYLQSDCQYIQMYCVLGDRKGIRSVKSHAPIISTSLTFWNAWSSQDLRS